ncbi:beta-lactamase [Candidatus Vecturithrix granuli]|uniref:Beta-lactamase n=1 Tax=Vecturithrix granuli TaxID=1499967 RepID=A0A081BXN9_VECG1|nr:beta-lactamase [Candidatus Vecturithrix granuli]
MQTSFDNIALNSSIEELMTQHQIIGLSLLVIQDREVVFTKGYGLAQRERQVPMTADTKCRVASISKPVTATALMQLYEQGQLDLNVDVSQYLGFPFRNPNFSDIPITLKHLLTHTSGLRDGSTYDEFLLQTTLQPEPGPITDILLPEGRFYHEDLWSPDFAPGDPDGWEYCNLASGVLATIIERISGEYFQPYCKTHIFDPLGMTCAYLPQDLPPDTILATIYRYDEDAGHFSSTYDDYTQRPPVRIPYYEFPLGYNGSLYSPQGGLRASVNDLSHFLLMQMNRGEYCGVRILRPETVALMHQVHWSGYGEQGRYRQKGLQFHLTDHLVSGVNLLGHAGDAYGLIGNMYCDREYQFGVIFLMNGGRFEQAASGFYDIEEHLMNAVFST